MSTEKQLGRESMPLTHERNISIPLSPGQQDALIRFALAKTTSPSVALAKTKDLPRFVDDEKGDFTLGKRLHEAARRAGVSPENLIAATTVVAGHHEGLVLWEQRDTEEK